MGSGLFNPIVNVVSPGSMAVPRALAQDDCTEEVSDSISFPDLGSLLFPTTGIISVPQFDTQGGTRTLFNVTVVLTQSYGGNGGAENRSSQPASLTLELGADMGAVGPGINDPANNGDVANSVVASPLSSFAAIAFDGTIDYAGTSGFTDTFIGVTDEIVLNELLSAPGDDLSAYIGAGTVNFTISSKSSSAATGAGDTESFFTTSGSAELRIIYGFCEPGLAVSLSYAYAERTPDQLINFTWETATETDNAGFNLYMALANGSHSLLTPDMVPSRVINSVAPVRYTYQAVAPGDSYYIEMVDLNGGNERFGPYAVGEPYGEAQVVDADNLDKSLYMPLIIGR